MALPEFSLRQLLEAGVHFGHQTQRWNPRMAPYIYGGKNGIHIMDLTQTVPLLEQALNVVRDTVAKGGRVLFVGTKRQAQKPIADAAERCAQYYMNHRWLGGTLTNWKTVSNSIARLKAIDEASAQGFAGLTKKERLGMERDQAKLEASLGGIREMGGVPDLLFVIDVNKDCTIRGAFDGHRLFVLWGLDLGSVSGAIFKFLFRTTGLFLDGLGIPARDQLFSDAVIHIMLFTSEHIAHGSGIALFKNLDFHVTSQGEMVAERTRPPFDI